MGSVFEKVLKMKVGKESWTSKCNSIFKWQNQIMSKVPEKQKMTKKFHFKYNRWTIWEWQAINYSRKIAGKKCFSSIQSLWIGKKKIMISDKKCHLHSYKTTLKEKLK